MPRATDQTLAPFAVTDHFESGAGILNHYLKGRATSEVSVSHRQPKSNRSIARPTH